MKYRNRVTLVIVVASSLWLQSCGGGSASTPSHLPATFAHLPFEGAGRARYKEIYWDTWWSNESASFPDVSVRYSAALKADGYQFKVQSANSILAIKHLGERRSLEVHLFAGRASNGGGGLEKIDKSVNGVTAVVYKEKYNAPMR